MLPFASRFLYDMPSGRALYFGLFHCDELVMAVTMILCATEELGLRTDKERYRPSEGTIIIG